MTRLEQTLDVRLVDSGRPARIMLVLLLVLMVWSGIAPADRTVWTVESVWSVGLLVVLSATRKWFKFSTAAYLCFWVWAVLQTIGAHYTFERVPMDWLMSPLDLTRNPYDRIAHFVVGWFAFPLAELFDRKGWVRSAGFAAFFAVMTTVAMAGVWEIVEWLYAAIDGGEAGAAFLGSQGDVWDAQKDILCDTLGALCAAVLYWVMRKDRQETDAICERLAAMKIGYGVRQMHIDKAFHGIYTTGGGLETKMGIYVKKSDYEQARPIAERIMQRVGCES